MGASKISLKLLIDTDDNKVLFAEAGKNCADFLFHLLSLPLGTVVRLLRKQQMNGSLENLYESIENLDEAYIQPNQNKDIFLSPKSSAVTPAPAVTLLALGEKDTGSKAFYTCSNSCSFSDASHSTNDSTLFGTVAFGSSSSRSYRSSSAPSFSFPPTAPAFSSSKSTSYGFSFSSTPSSSSVQSAKSTSCGFSFSSTPSSSSVQSAKSTSCGFSFSSTPSSSSVPFSPLFGSSSSPSTPSFSFSPSRYVSDDPGAVCPQCSRTMSLTMKYVAPPRTGTGGAGDINESGFVKDTLPYMIMDDLEVKPMSTISSINLLNKFNVKNFGSLKEKAVDLGMNEALKLLKASLGSKTVLTDVFLDDEEK